MAWSSLASAATDLALGWIARLPKIDYVWGSTHPKVDGWPNGEQTVSWHGVLKNRGAAANFCLLSPGTLSIMPWTG